MCCVVGQQDEGARGHHGGAAMLAGKRGRWASERIPHNYDCVSVSTGYYNESGQTAEVRDFCLEVESCCRTLKL